MVINSSYNFISNTLTPLVAPLVVSQPVVIATGTLCAIPAIELGIRTFQDATDLLSICFPSEKGEDNLKQNRIDARNKIINELISHLAKTILLGACALNVFTGSGAIGLVGFMIYSKAAWKDETNCKNPSTSIMVTGVAVMILNHYKMKILKACFCNTIALVKKIVAKAMILFKGVWHAFKSLAHGIKKFVFYPFKLIARGAVKLAALLVKIGKVVAKLFMHKPLIGLGLLAAAGTAFIFIKVVPISGIVAVIDTLARHIFTAVITVVKFIPDVAAAGGKVLLGAVRVVGTVLGFVPAVIMKVGSAVGYVFGY